LSLYDYRRTHGVFRLALHVALPICFDPRVPVRHAAAPGRRATDRSVQRVVEGAQAALGPDGRGIRVSEVTRQGACRDLRPSAERGPAGPAEDCATRTDRRASV